MNPILIEPTDVLFFRDAVPMSAGQGKGVGCRLPFPSTLHEAFRASLLRVTGETPNGKNIEGRPRHAPKHRNWHIQTWPEQDQRRIATRDYRSLRTIGPLPLHLGKGLLLPVPLDVARDESGGLARLQLWRDDALAGTQQPPTPSDYRPLCLPLATTPPDKQNQLHGWWSTTQMCDYLDSKTQRLDNDFSPVPTSELWSAEHRVGIQVDPGTFAAEHGQLYAGSYLRANHHIRLVAWAEIADPTKANNSEAATRAREREQLRKLDWLLFGGEFRLARLWRQHPDGKAISNPLGPLRMPPAPPSADGPCLLKWVLVTPAIFAHGSLPGWCADTKQDRPGGSFPVGRVCLNLPGRAQLISWCLGKPRTVSGFDVVEGRAKPTMLAVPEGGVYFFLCENRATAETLAQILHWRPRSDIYGEKGCGYGLVSFDVRMHPMSMSLEKLKLELFPDTAPTHPGFLTTDGSQSALHDPMELRDSAVAYVRGEKQNGLPQLTAAPEPWSHPWHDQLGLLYHKAIAGKIQANPNLRAMAIGNIDRWMSHNEYPASVVRSLQGWRDLLTSARLEPLIAAMTDPSEHGHQERQNTPFAGLLTQEERRRIRDDYEKSTTH